MDKLIATKDSPNGYYKKGDIASFIREANYIRPKMLLVKKEGAKKSIYVLASNWEDNYGNL